MKSELLNIILAFVEGFALIISPCILPILPIILSGSIQGGKKRPYGIIVGFATFFLFFTFFSRKLVQLFGIDINIIRNISFVFLFALGVIMLSDYLSEKFDLLMQRLANVGSSWEVFNKPKTDFLSGFLFGGLIGIIWTPCAGPILAAVILQTVLQKTDLSSFFTVLSFVVGVSIPMLAITIFGRDLIKKFPFFKTKAIFLRRLLGGIIIASVIYMLYGDKIIASVEKPKENVVTAQNMLLNPINKSYGMPQIAGIAAWINSEPIEMEQLRNKVVLIDFWTYSCINCIRTLPHLKDLYEKYHQQGLLIIGVHSPEFDFEKKLQNVENAVRDFGIKYPVALDNDFVTWRNYANQYWPAHYLIDKNGQVVYQQFGEGKYDILENNIRFLLGMNKIPTQTEEAERFLQTPETYLGYARADRFKSPEFSKPDENKKYSYPENLSENDWALQGNWIITAQYISSGAVDSAIKIHFAAGKVYAVMGSNSGKPMDVKLFLNGKPAPKKIISVTNKKLYTLIEESVPTKGILELIAPDSGLEIYAFTFGN